MYNVHASYMGMLSFSRSAQTTRGNILDIFFFDSNDIKRLYFDATMNASTFIQWLYASSYGVS